MNNKKIGLVRGGLGGIGSAISQCSAADGFRVVGNYLVPGSEQTWLQAMREADFHDAHTTLGDVGDFDAMAGMVKKIVAGVGSVDVLVNCAGITRDSQFRKMSKQDWDSVININLNGAFNVTRHVIDAMVERGWGRIINISPVNGQKGQFGQVNYSAAKAGLHGFTKALAQEVIRHGVTVNSISPGYVSTDLVMAIRPEVREKIVAQIPAGRLAHPEEIGHMVAYLASDKAVFISGANMAVNGGQHMF